MELGCLPVAHLGVSVFTFQEMLPGMCSLFSSLGVGVGAGGEVEWAGGVPFGGSGWATRLLVGRVLEFLVGSVIKQT